MKIVKSISLFVLYPAVMFLAGMAAGIWAYGFFYPGYGNILQNGSTAEYTEQTDNDLSYSDESENTDSVSAAKVSDRLTADTVYVLEETDTVRNTVVETEWTLPAKYIGMDREQFLASIMEYGTNPPLSELERGFTGLEVLSFSADRVVVGKYYQYTETTEGFYLAVYDNEVVVYLDDCETLYFNTGISLEELPEDIQQAVIQMMWMPDEESLYDFLETYSS
jgi:hypothetical protein